MATDATRRRRSSARLLARVACSLHRGLYRLTGGQLGAARFPLPLLLLTTTGRKSGRPRTWPLGYSRDGDRLIVGASAGGQPEHPAWYLNLCATPRVAVQIGRERRRMVATVAEGAERARLWARLVDANPDFVAYQQRVTRPIPVVILTPPVAA